MSEEVVQGTLVGLGYGMNQRMESGHHGITDCDGVLLDVKVEEPKCKVANRFCSACAVKNAWIL